jgi:hypothetical protein
LPLRQMKRKLTFLHRLQQLLPHYPNTTVVGQLQVVDTGHHRRQVAVDVLVRRIARIRGIVRFAHDGQGRHQRLQAAHGQSRRACVIIKVTLLINHYNKNKLATVKSR